MSIGNLHQLVIPCQFNLYCKRRNLNFVFDIQMNLYLRHCLSYLSFCKAIKFVYRRPCNCKSRSVVLINAWNHFRFLWRDPLRKTGINKRKIESFSFNSFVIVTRWQPATSFRIEDRRKKAWLYDITLAWVTEYDFAIDGWMIYDAATWLQPFTTENGNCHNIRDLLINIFIGTF